MIKRQGVFMAAVLSGPVMLVAFGQPANTVESSRKYAEELMRDASTRVISAETQPIQEVLNDFHEAAAAADFGRYFKHWTAASVFLGTDATERWVGDEFKEFARLKQHMHLAGTRIKNHLAV